jgi:hypothetical protein
MVKDGVLVELPLYFSVFDQCGVDIVLVGDSLGNVIKGGENTLGVSMNALYNHPFLIQLVVANQDAHKRGYDYLVKF